MVLFSNHCSGGTASVRHRMEETSSWTRNVKCETHGILCPRDPSGQFFFSSEGSCLISNEKSLILRPKVWIFYKTPNIENLNCDIYLTIWTFKKLLRKTGILLELSQLSFSGTF